MNKHEHHLAARLSGRLDCLWHAGLLQRGIWEFGGAKFAPFQAQVVRGGRFVFES